MPLDTDKACPVAKGHRDSIQQEMLKRYLSDLLGEHCLLVSALFLLSRQHAAYGDDGLKYKYSGVTVAAKPWTPGLKHLKEIVEKHSGFKYNFVLVNR